jgi:DnaJ family protein B protein 4
MASMPNFYDIIGVNKDATPEQIKKQYRKLSLDLHPDRPNGDRSKFELLKEAYEMLSDKDKRRQYDVSQRQPFMGEFSTQQHSGASDIQQEMLDMLFNPMNGMNSGLFSTDNPQVKVFHGGMQMPMQMQMQMQADKPPPIDIKLEITLDQAFTGCSTPIQVERWAFHNETKVSETETCYIDVPAGVDNNETILVPAKGHVAPHGLTGDVRVSISIENTSKLKRQGLDLIYSHTISLREALCGFSFDMEYLQGRIIKINNSSGSIISPHYKKKVPKMGFNRGANQGDLIIEFNIVFPSSLTPEQILTLSTTL